MACTKAAQTMHTTKFTLQLKIDKTAFQLKVDHL